MPSKPGAVHWVDAPCGGGSGSLSAGPVLAAVMGQVLGALVFQRMSGEGEGPDAKTIVTLFLRGALRTEQEGGRAERVALTWRRAP